MELKREKFRIGDVVETFDGGKPRAVVCDIQKVWFCSAKSELNSNCRTVVLGEYMICVDSWSKTTTSSTLRPIKPRLVPHIIVWLQKQNEWVEILTCETSWLYTLHEEMLPASNPPKWKQQQIQRLEHELTFPSSVNDDSCCSIL